MEGHNEIITVGAVTLNRIEYQGRPMLTVKQIAQVHGKTENAVRSTYAKHKSRFVEGMDVFAANSSEGRAITGAQCPNGLLLFSESGYLKLVKTFEDDKAWEVHGRLMDAYFRLKAIAAPVPATAAQALLQQGQLHLQALQLLVEQEARVSALEGRTLEIEAKLTTRNEDFYTVAGYCKKRGIQKGFTREDYRLLGKEASALSRERSYAIEDVYDAKYGTVHAYHVDILSMLFGKRTINFDAGIGGGS